MMQATTPNKSVKYAPTAPDSLNEAIAAGCRLPKRYVPSDKEGDIV